MTQINRIRVPWTGFPGGPGVSTFYTTAPFAVGSTGWVRTFFNSLASYLPNTVSIQVPGAGDIINDTDGSLAGSWADSSTPAVVVGTSASGYAAPTGMIVRWVTDEIVRHKRLMGRTFLVPFANVFEPGGTPLAATVTAVTTAANTLRTNLSSGLAVWSRPLMVPETHPPVIDEDGTHAIVTSVFVPDKAVVLRSRRD